MSDLFSDGRKAQAHLFHTADGKVIGSSRLYRISVGLLIGSILGTGLALTNTVARTTMESQSQQALWQHAEWFQVDAVTSVLSFTMGMFLLPLILSAVSLFQKKYTDRLKAVPVLSASLCGVIIWVLMILSVNNFLM